MTVLPGPLPEISGALAAAPLSRREALRLLGLALAGGVAGCKPAEDIVPLVTNPSGRLAGEPLQFATSLPLGGYGRGVLGTSVEGRPIKVSGNALHPASLGATDLFAEAEILNLYDPDRSRTLLKDGAIANWETLLAELRPRRANWESGGGKGLALLTGRVTSPTLIRQIADLRQRFPALRHFRHEPLCDDNARAGSRAAFGRVLDMLPHWERADVVLCLGADPLGPGPAQIRNGRGLSARRRVRNGAGEMQRLYVVESMPTLTGHVADHRLALSPDRILDFAALLGTRFGGPKDEREGVDHRFLAAVEADLRKAGAKALVLVGDGEPPETHALGAWLNGRLGAFGQTLDLIEPVDPVIEGHGESLAAFAAAIRHGEVETAFVLGTNPVYDAPSDFDFADLLRRVPFALHLGSYRDETGFACRWHVPESHPLEAWGDIRAVDGTAGIVQPLIRPLYATRTASELLAALTGDETPDARRLVRETWMQTHGGDGFEDWWLRVVEAGVVPETTAPAVPLPALPALPAAPTLPKRTAPDGFALLFHADPTIGDGRYANNAWLQECPKPATHLTWGNALRIGEADARRLGLASGDAVRIEAGDRHLDAPVFVDRGMAEGVVALSLGYGRDKVGAIGIGLGVNAYRLRRSDALWTLSGVRLSRIGKGEPLPLTQVHLTEEGRDLAPEIDLGELAAGKRLRPSDDPPPSFYGTQSTERTAPGEATNHAWAMVIDTGACIGCNACVVACQAENNVPVVGPDEIRADRDMHWLRVDSYEKPEDGRTVFQPVPCMHCEKAPCEPVCPVGASVHDHEGLNVQVYNRCIGTRFCQANCPYKVRRFNFFGYAVGQEYANLGAAPLQARFNPDVTVRGRGVMEKCTYCVQRIAGARQKAEAEGRPLRDGEVVTACAAACPTDAIRFGDLALEGSEIRTLRQEPQHYALLEEVGTRPRTTYLARVRNANPEIGEGER